ncbi:MAG: protoporphyrinogen oxidase [Acidobacteriota bacterium]
MSSSEQNAETLDLPIAVVGGGIAGLTAAFRLRQAGRSVRLLEASSRLGGTIASQRQDGFLFEHGPTTVPSSAPSLARLIDDSGLRPRAQLSRKIAGRRLVWRGGRLHALPEKPPQLLTCTALGAFAKVRLLAEPWIPKRKPGGPPETLLEFGRRRLGKGAVRAFLDPFVTGVHAGRLDELGVDALPRLLDLEADHGSLFRGLIAQRKVARSAAEARGEEPPSGPPPLVSFPDGLETLPAHLAEFLADSVLPGREVKRLEILERGRYRLRTAEGDSLLASGVILTTPSEITAGLLPSGIETDFLTELPHPFVATVGLGYARQQLIHPLDAFGMLVAGDSRYSEADVLGILFSSSIFEGRAPEGSACMTVMIGGSRDPEAAALDDAQLIRRARDAAARFLGASGEPRAVTVARWPRAIPQLVPGHRERVRALRRQLAQVGGGGLAVAGNYLDGVGVEAAVASADRAAADVLDIAAVAGVAHEGSPALG